MVKSVFPHKDYSTISPSAKDLLLLKGLTNLPFAKQAAELVTDRESFELYNGERDLYFWARAVHFEERYVSVDQLLDELPIKNILELSSGFSFRGLNKVKQDGIHYIDTDLSEVIELKKGFINPLQTQAVNPLSKLETLALNALDEAQFEEIVNRFPAGEIAIVNEGLLMYLNDEEKARLCKIIHKVLSERGGYWITADIYIKANQEIAIKRPDNKLQQFLEQHRVEENKFDSFEAAESFFKNAGFTIDKEAETDFTKVSTIKNLLNSVPGNQFPQGEKLSKMRATWRLKV
jgi:O-methyltransferase involved in polyketide biosynthesis